MKIQQSVMFSSGEDSPLFSLMPVPVPDPPVSHRVVISMDQMLLLEPACRLCFDLGEIKNNGKLVYCWCAAALELRQQRAKEETEDV